MSKHCAAIMNESWFLGWTKSTRARTESELEHGDNTAPSAAATIPEALAMWLPPTPMMTLATAAAIENEPRLAAIALAQCSQKGCLSSHDSTSGGAAQCPHASAVKPAAIAPHSARSNAMRGPSTSEVTNSATGLQHAPHVTAKAATLGESRASSPQYALIVQSHPGRQMHVARSAAPFQRRGTRDATAATKPPAARNDDAPNIIEHQ